ncbi:MAG TPA: hypothetical protein VM582_02550 [Candidatus Thermoplasmatota archaeon]|nr:hypothetical protein [Candidatus Thermoplasmatota archaeon]
MPLAHVGLLDETWLFRVAHDAPVRERVEGVAGVAAVTESSAPYALVRTLAQDAVERERLLRALHARLGERPLAQLHRAPAPLARKPTPEDRALLRALRRHPWGALDELARAAKLAPKAARERLARLVAERAASLDAAPLDAPTAHALVRASPSSTAAARRAFDAVEGVVRAWLPAQGEATYADALVVGAPSLDAAREVPGVASVELLPVRAAWEDDALIERALGGGP